MKQPGEGSVRERRIDLTTAGGLLALIVVGMLFFLTLKSLNTLITSLGESTDQFNELSKRALVLGEQTRSEKEVLKKYLAAELSKEYAAQAALQARLDVLNADLAAAEAIRLNVVETTDNATVPCLIGSATVIAPRRTRNGTEYVYWEEMMDKMPGKDKVQIVAVLNKLGRPIVHRIITHVLEDLPGDPPEFDKRVLMRPLKRNHNDSTARIKWRSKVCLDFVRLMRFVTDRCRFALWIEDDAVLHDNFIETVKKSFALRAAHTMDSTWTHHYFGNGMPGVLVNSYYAHEMLQYITHHFDDEPVDWALSKFNDYMRKKVPGLRHFETVNFIGHRGAFSSLSEADVRPTY
jgi:hypothetical protein